jgi:hypothetical protein
MKERVSAGPVADLAAPKRADLRDSYPSGRRIALGMDIDERQMPQMRGAHQSHRSHNSYAIAASLLKLQQKWRIPAWLRR